MKMYFSMGAMNLKIIFNYRPLIFRTLAFVASNLGYEIEKVIGNDCQMFGALNKIF
jgi:hypothetical protein